MKFLQSKILWSKFHFSVFRWFSGLLCCEFLSSLVPAVQIFVVWVSVLNLYLPFVLVNVTLHLCGIQQHGPVVHVPVFLFVKQILLVLVPLVKVPMFSDSCNQGSC